MLTVDEHELIRRKYFVDGMTQRAIAKELGHARKTVKKAITHLEPPPFKKPESRKKPTLAPVIPIIDAWLEQDQHRPRKQRHTAQRIYERLVEEHHYQGHSSTVRRYVGSWKRLRPKEVFFPLVFDPGEEAQVDWGEATIIENGRKRTVQLFCMRLCHSKLPFVRAYEHANLESFLDGHVRALEFFGGVPHRLAYDNLRCAVMFQGRGRQRKRHMTESFRQLRSWYLFDTRFCNVARGNEKGHVENLVKRAQRTFLTPVPEVTSLEQLNQKLVGDCRRELDRNEPDGTSRQQRWQTEREALLPLGDRPFPACRKQGTRVDKFSLVAWDRHFYSVPVRWAHQPCQVHAFVDRVDVYCDHHLVASHPRCYEGRQRFVLDPMHYLPLLERKPGALDQARPFKGAVWGEDFTHLRRELEYRYHEDGTRQFIRVLLLLTEYPEQDVREAVRECVRRRAYNEEAVRHVLRNGCNPPADLHHRLDLSDRPELATVGEGIRSPGTYDQLREQPQPKETAA